MNIRKFVPKLLKSEMIKKEKNAEDISRELGIDTTTFYRKIKCESEFTRQEMAIIRYALNLTGEEMDSIFFAE